MGRIRQILINIINKEIKFTKEAYVRLDVSGQYQDKENINLRFVIEDTGIGIKEEYIAVIFEAFRHLDMNRKRKTEGTGLGLAITQQLIILMDGNTAIERVKRVEYDMILMAHMMPEMVGMDATKIIRSECGENGKKAVIIALAANALQGACEMYLENGFDDFLSKPFDRSQLHELLNKWIPAEMRV